MCFHARSRHRDFEYVDDLDPEAAEEAQERRKRRFVARATGVGTCFLICMTIWLVSGAGAAVWPLWVLVIGGLSLGKEARELYGGDDDRYDSDDRDRVLTDA